jgi:hypothetical protein
MKLDNEAEITSAAFDHGVRIASSLTVGDNVASAAYLAGLACGLGLILSELLGDDAMRATMADAAETAIELRKVATQRAN